MKLFKKLSVATIAVLMTSCAVDPVYINTKLPLPETPDYPYIDSTQIRTIYSCGEYFTVVPEHCDNPVQTPYDQVPTEIMQKLVIKNSLKTKYIKQLEAVIKATH